MSDKRKFQTLDEMFMDKHVGGWFYEKYHTDMPYGTMTGDTGCWDEWLTEYYCANPEALEEDLEKLNIELEEEL